MRIAFLLPVLALAAPLAPAVEPAPAAAVVRAAPPAVVTVDGRRVSPAQFEQALAAAVRMRYYHRTPPEGEMAPLRREVADALVEIILVADEARRRGLAPDAARVDKDLETIEARFRGRPGWAEHRAAQVATWRADLEDRDLAEALEKRTRADVSPTPAQARAFHEANPALFTEPEKVRVGLILLKVDPSAGRAARDRARDEATGIVQRLAKGADFAELAKIHSGDDSGPKGGDLGYVHRGALPEAIQAAADALDGGRISAPIDVLEGIAIIRVSDRQPARLRPYADVAARATELLRRKAADEAWKSFVAALRAKAKVEIDADRYPELAGASDPARAAAASASR
jgi:parvulin-like peptidyl-prolyl isomerase